MFLAKWESLQEYNSVIGTIVSDFMMGNDVSTIAVGRYELQDGCYVNVDEYETRENYKFEAHRTYLDVQIMVNGEEDIICAPLFCGVETVAYDIDKDVAFYQCEEKLQETIRLKPYMALVLLPCDMHAPCNLKTKRQNRKLVFKIPVDIIGGIA